MDLTTNPPISLDSLTAAQREAATHIDGPLMVLAGPGSGKTRVVTYRIANMLQQGIAPHNILALTFTNKAANEMQARLQRLVPNSQIFASTFHRFCSRMLRKYAGLAGLNENFSIFDMNDSKRLLKNVIKENNVQINHYSNDELAREISSAKQNLIHYEQFAPRTWKPIDAIVAKVYPLYQKSLLLSNAVDFDDLLFHIATLLRESESVRASLDDRFRYVSVDEYQDTNSAQYEIVRAISSDHPNIAVTGDPDQSIYGWRGANLNNILDFEKHYPNVRVVKLEQNYRSTQRILSVADSLISHNIKRKQKSLFTENEAGEPVRLVTFATQKDESEQIAQRIGDELHNGRKPREFAIFYRINALSRSIEIALRSHRIPYQVVNGHEFYQRKEVKDLLAYLQILVNPQNEIALERIINVPSRKIGNVTFNKLKTHARRYGVSVLDAAREARLNESLSAAARKNILKFVETYDRLAAVVHEPAEAIMGHVLAETGYREMFDVVNTPEDEDRIANIDELLNAAREYDDENPDGGLEGFLEQTSLVSDIDGWEGEDDRVTLMTLHAAKGLEFPSVFMIALEEGVLPHSRKSDDPDYIEEERRLMFVGITRAEKELQISYAANRLRQGSMQMNSPSRFLMELPRGEMQMIEPPTRQRFYNDYQDGFDTGHDLDDVPSVQVYRDEIPDESSPKSKTPRIMTAADMLAGGAKRDRVPVENYRLGKLVSSEDYGAGKIVALSGSGPKRVATVEFFEHGQIKFRLAHCDLRLIDG
jgi:DNA helicase-2/ATP-dependent DNA helicase PcrA